MRKGLIAIRLLLAAAPAVAFGQAAEPGTALRSSTVEPMTGTAYRSLFRDITLTSQQETKAKAVIREAFTVLLGINTSTQAGRDSVVTLLERRDSVLRTLVTKDADRRVFDARSAAMRPKAP